MSDEAEAAAWNEWLRDRPIAPNQRQVFVAGYRAAAQQQEPDVGESEREELIEALQYPTKWRDRGLPTEQILERAMSGHDAAQVVDEYLLPVVQRLLAARLDRATKENNHE